MKLYDWVMTPVFPEHIKPVRSGVYRIPAQPGLGAGWAYFNAKSKLWGWTAGSRAEAYLLMQRKPLGAAQDKRWQGLRQEYKA